MGVWHGLVDRVTSPVTRWGGADRARENARQACVRLSQRRVERDEVQLFLEQQGVMIRSA
jgi:hypothetical protein